ncbi:unnamed protein product [Cuscuta campestris]|uniref:Uncharacterized protein n=1 Tax=Cuscuta campestris TaxID=132261 RepID=A0A484L411_9ASTE|nr:unnamed protein product [Cuscuta campestris]
MGFDDLLSPFWDCSVGQDNDDATFWDLFVEDNEAWNNEAWNNSEGDDGVFWNSCNDDDDNIAFCKLFEEDDDGSTLNHGQVYDPIFDYEFDHDTGIYSDEYDSDFGIYYDGF